MEPRAESASPVVEASPARPGGDAGDVAVDPELQLRLVQLRSIVDAALTDAMAGIDPRCLQEAMRYSLLGPGKRLRPILCLITGEMVGVPLEQVLPTACALEMLHAATLIHDDLPAMDNDDFRRGRPSNHMVFGQGMALLAGDALLAYSLQHIVDATTEVDQVTLLQVLAELIRVVGPAGLSGGQAVDLDSQGRDQVDLATLVDMHRRKTGALIRAAVVTGGLLGGATAAQLDPLRAYADKVGLAYQITDDILDQTASFAELGKVTGRDSVLDKWTFPRLLGLDAARQRAQHLIDDAIEDLADFGAAAKPLHQLALVIYERAAA